jgi:hypothetical protein
MAYADWETLETDIAELKVLFNFLKEHRANPKRVDYSQYPENERAYWKRAHENGGKHGLAELSSFTRVDKNKTKNAEGIEVGSYSPGWTYYRGPKGEVSFSTSGGNIVKGYRACYIYIPTDPTWRPRGEPRGVLARRRLTEDEIDEVTAQIYDTNLLFEVKTYFTFTAFDERSFRAPSVNGHLKSIPR